MESGLFEAIDEYILKCCPYAKANDIKDCSDCEKCLWHDEALMIYKSFLQGAKFVREFNKEKEKEI